MIPNWQKGLTGGFKQFHLAGFYDDEMGLEMAVYTPKRPDGSFGKSRMRYSIKGVRKIFLSEDEMLDEWERRQKPGGIRIDDRCAVCGVTLDSEAP